MLHAILKKTFISLSALILIACANTPAMHVERKISHAPIPDASTPLAQALSKAKHTDGQLGAYPLVDGVQALAIRTSLIKNARKNLDVQYHSIHKGISTALLTQETILAARRGVKIRILVDGVDAQGSRSELDLIAGEPNIELRIFNPVKRMNNNFFTRNGMFLLHINRLHRRMHHKLLIADGAIGLTGGRNIGDAYFSADGLDNFSDIDVLLGGAAVQELGKSFDTYWNSANSWPVQALHAAGDQPTAKDVQNFTQGIQTIMDNAHAKKHPYVAAVEQAEHTLLPQALQGMEWGDVRVISDPDTKINHSPVSRQIILTGNPDAAVFNQTVAMIRAAKSEVLIVNAYILPGDALTTLLEETVKRGVSVIVVTNSLDSNDVPFAMAHFGKYRSRLIKAGVQWYELRGFPLADAEGKPVGTSQFFSNGNSRLALHTKAMVVDGRNAFVGSMNLDPRSIVWNTEMGVFFDNAPFAQTIRKVLLNAAQPEYSYAVRMDEQGRVTWTLPPVLSAHDLKYYPNRTPEIEPSSRKRKLIKWLAKIVPETYM